jgi:hypothetical protein
MFLYPPARMAAMLFAFEIVLEIGNAMLDWPVQYLLCVCVGGGGGRPLSVTESHEARTQQRGALVWVCAQTCEAMGGKHATRPRVCMRVRLRVSMLCFFARWRWPLDTV